MLVLSRKAGEKIIINGTITLTVMEMVGGRVRLGIEAPRNVPVHRKEVWDMIQDTNKRGDKERYAKDQQADGESKQPPAE